ncbi:MAG: pyruvate kinase [Gammaproteobacteria bacterium]|nr:MAG: pyruvate kinase [Gammaproteobacteria bacterium]
MRRDRFAKIVATLGPASSDPVVLENLFIEGVDVFRLNFSHGSYQTSKKNIETIRSIEKKYNRPIAILADLQGPKFRVGRFENDRVTLTLGQEFVFDNNQTPGNQERVYLPHPEIFEAVSIGDRLLIDDARVCFEVIANDGQRIVTKHIYGKSISNNKGLNMPDTILDVPVLTPKDEEDLDFILTQQIDYIALSFVQRASDMSYLRQRVGNQFAILAKIEKPSAVDDIDNILQASDAVMLARGDLGVEYPPERLPGIQKYVICKAREAGKPIIVATQMLESMIDSPVATRAEAIDVASAIYEGVDAVMLSGETAMGKYPVQAVNFMNRLIIESERTAHFRSSMQSGAYGQVKSSEGAIAQAVRAVSGSLPIAAIACFTTSGSTATRLVRERALTPLLALTPGLKRARKLQLYWGIDADVLADIKKFKTVIIAAAETIESRGYGKRGDWFVITVGVPFGEPGSTNTLRLARIGEEYRYNDELIKDKHQGETTTKTASKQ